MFNCYDGESAVFRCGCSLLLLEMVRWREFYRRDIIIDAQWRYISLALGAITEAY